MPRIPLLSGLAAPGLLLLVAACAIACGSTGETSNGAVEAGAVDAPLDAQADAGACYALDIPASWRACTSSADCQVGLTEVDFCETRRAVGIARASFASFQQAETAMEKRCPQGTCAASATTADDGTTAPKDNQFTQPGVSCQPMGGSGAGVCTTSFGGPDAGEGGAADAGAD